MHTVSLTLKKETIITSLIVMFFVIPYLETGPFSFAITDSVKTFYWRSILTFQLAVFVILVFQYGTLKIKGSYNKLVLLFTVYLVFNSLISITLGAGFGATIVMFLSIVLPIANSYYLVMTVDKRFLDINKIIKWSVNCYAAFVVFCIVFNVMKYGLILSLADNKYRLSASAGGPVILGYTVSLVLIFMLSNKDLFPRKNVIVNSIIFFLAIAFTMDRGAYVIVLIGLIYLVVTERNIVNTSLLIIGLIFGAFYFSDELLSRIIELLFGNRVMASDVTQTMRFVTASNCLSEYIQQPAFFLSGHGLGNFFPFQHWTATYSGVGAEAYKSSTFNLFSYNGKLFLIQPHNTIVYLLMETGLIGVYFFFRLAFLGIKNPEGKRSSKVIIVVIAFVVLALFESTIIIQPGIACMWWLMLLLTKRRCNTLR